MEMSMVGTKGVTKYIRLPRFDPAVLFKPVIRPKFIILVLVLAFTEVRAQDSQATPTPMPGGLPVWRCELPGGIYEVALRSIVSVSSHEYIVDGAARVTEVNVDTTGSMTVRFYYLEPITPTSPLGIGQSTINKVQEMGKELMDRTGQGEVWQKVVKNYPTTTHARTIEYRLESQDQLDKLFQSAETAFRLNRNTTFKP
jgi:hypothetical protein